MALPFFLIGLHATGLLKWSPLHAVGKVAAAWEVPGVHAPHDMAVVASPVRLAGKERPLALLVAETWEAGNSQLHKFILLPEGVLLGPALPGAITCCGSRVGASPLGFSVLPAHTHSYALGARCLRHYRYDLVSYSFNLLRIPCGSKSHSAGVVSCM